MKSIRVRVGIIPAAAAALVLTACGATTTATQGTSGGAALIHTASTKVGDKTESVLKNKAGLTLYYFTPDTATTVTCTGGCATTWPPLIADAGTPTSADTLPGRLSVVDGANGKQVLYNGHPLYMYSKDGDAGDAYGQGIGGKWFVATPDLAAAASASATSVYRY